MNNQINFISAILKRSFNQKTIQNVGNWRRIKTKETDIPVNALLLNNSEPNSKEQIIKEIENSHSLFTATLVIDSFILNDSEIMNAINKKLQIGGTTSVRIEDEGYILTKKDYEKLKAFSCIFVDYTSDEINNEKKIITQKELFKLNEQVEQPVIERRNKFDEVEFRMTFHITHKLIDSELKDLVCYLNNVKNANLELNIYEPNYYEELFNKLQLFGLKKDCNITLIGYPLEDSSNTYSLLEKYPFEMDIIYSTCHDMVNAYEQEPFVEKKLVYSQLEGSGKTTLQNYVNLLKTLEEVEKNVKDKNYSPLETAIYAKSVIDDMYIYDPDYNSQDVDFWDNTNLSQVINHNDGKKKRAICVGFSTLYSAMLRRCNIPMFRYSAPGHMRNIGRIRDDKYNVDTISIFDITYDLKNTNNGSSFCFFGLSPRTLTKKDRSEFLTIANSLVLPWETYQRLLTTSIDPVENFYSHQYHPLGYTCRMLELMKYIDDNEKIIDIYKILYKLSLEDHLDDIEIEAILQAYLEVQRKENNISKDEEQIIIDNFRNSIAERKRYFTKKESILCNTPIETVEEVDLVTKENAKDLLEELEKKENNRPVFFKKELLKEENGNIIVDISEEQKSTDNTNNNDNELSTKEENKESFIVEDDKYIKGTHILKPRERDIYENDLEYENYLQAYYSSIFPNTNNEDNDKYIKGTRILKPRERDIYETDLEYEKYLEEYYNKYFPTSEENNKKVR